jgi:hypothetical protein
MGLNASTNQKNVLTPWYRTFLEMLVKRLLLLGTMTVSYEKYSL